MPAEENDFWSFEGFFKATKSRLARKNYKSWVVFCGKNIFVIFKTV
jgi:hypothetical protein